MRTIRDEYELPEDDEGDENVGSLLRKRRHHVGLWIIGFALLVLLGAGIYSLVWFGNAQQTDSFCIDCHTAPEVNYVDRANSAMAGALANDLASFHYQQIKGQGGTLHCIECHQGTGNMNHRFDVITLSTRNALLWMIGQNDTRLEKQHLQVPQLANAACVSCHQKTLLLTGMDNHWHNMLPVAYDVWHNGGRLIAPPGVKDTQSIIAAGLVKYTTAVVCTDCHQAHKTSEDAQYLDRVGVVAAECVQCHRDVGKGPLEVTLPASQ
jgi:nitrate/TMAO reductase-like tetraheme cytochrome c subunit